MCMPLATWTKYRFDSAGDICGDVTQSSTRFASERGRVTSGTDVARHKPPGRDPRARERTPKRESPSGEGLSNRHIEIEAYVRQIAGTCLFRPAVRAQVHTSGSSIVPPAGSAGVSVMTGSVAAPVLRVVTV